jgi:hypothetical protein
MDNKQPYNQFPQQPGYGQAQQQPMYPQTGYSPQPQAYSQSPPMTQAQFGQQVGGPVQMVVAQGM